MIQTFSEKQNKKRTKQKIHFALVMVLAGQF